MVVVVSGLLTICICVLVARAMTTTSLLSSVVYENEYCLNTTNDAPLSSTDHYRNRTLWNCSEFWQSESNLTQLLQRSLSQWDPQTTLQSSALNAVRLRRVFGLLSQPNATVNVFVFGGSMTAGRFVRGHKGAWPQELEVLWNNQRQRGSRLSVTNHGHAGTSTAWLLPRLCQYFIPPAHADLVVLDYDINDMAVWSDSPQHRLDLQAHMEILIRRLLLLPSGPAVVYLNVATSHHVNKVSSGIQPWCSEYHTAWQLGAVKGPIVTHPSLSVPVVSQKQALWRNWVCPPTTQHMDCKSKGCAHPSWAAHLLFSQFMLQFLRVGTDAMGSAPSLGSRDGGERAAREALLQAPLLAENSPGLDARTCLDLRSVLDEKNAEDALRDYGLRQRGRFNGSSDAGRSGILLLHLGACWGFRSDVAGKTRGWIGGDTHCDVASLRTTNASTRNLNASLSHEEGYDAESIHFLVTLGLRGTLSVNSLQTWNATAGLATLAATAPLTPAEAAAALAGTWRPPLGAFRHLSMSSGLAMVRKISAAAARRLQGLIDFHGDYVDQEAGHSVIVPSVWDSDPLLVPNSTLALRLTLVDANAEPWRTVAGRSAASKLLHRQAPQKAKIFGLSTC